MGLGLIRPWINSGSQYRSRSIGPEPPGSFAWVQSPGKCVSYPYGIILWIVLPSVLFRIPGRRNPRLRPRFLLVSKCRRLVRLCLTLPVLLKVKRLAALREVLILGIFLPSLPTKFVTHS